MVEQFEDITFVVLLPTVWEVRGEKVHVPGSSPTQNVVVPIRRLIPSSPQTPEARCTKLCVYSRLNRVCAQISLKTWVDTVPLYSLPCLADTPFINHLHIECCLHHKLLGRVIKATKVLKILVLECSCLTHLKRLWWTAEWWKPANHPPCQHCVLLVSYSFPRFFSIAARCDSPLLHLFHQYSSDVLLFKMPQVNKI